MLSSSGTRSDVYRGATTDANQTALTSCSKSSGVFSICALDGAFVLLLPHLEQDHRVGRDRVGDAPRLKQRDDIGPNSKDGQASRQIDLDRLVARHLRLLPFADPRLPFGRQFVGPCLPRGSGRMRTAPVHRANH
jgi:hypothetical protein